MIFPYQAYSNTADDIKKQIQNINDQRTAIDKEIEMLSNQIVKTAEEKNIPNEDGVPGPARSPWIKNVGAYKINYGVDDVTTGQGPGGW